MHSIVGETGADDRYAVHTSFPHFAFSRPGRAFMAFLGNAEFVSTGSVALILKTETSVLFLVPCLGRPYSLSNPNPEPVRVRVAFPSQTVR